MTDKELKRLSRRELLQMLIDQISENQSLQARLDEAERALADRRIAVEASGSLAEAALRLSGIFQAADEAAQQYLDNLRERSSQAGQHQAELDEKRRQTEAELDEKRRETEAGLDEKRRKTELSLCVLREEAGKQANALRRRAEAEAAAIRREADEYSEMTREAADAYQQQIAAQANAMLEHQNELCLRGCPEGDRTE